MPQMFPLSMLMLFIMFVMMLAFGLIRIFWNSSMTLHHYADNNGLSTWSLHTLKMNW